MPGGRLLLQQALLPDLQPSCQESQSWGLCCLKLTLHVLINFTRLLSLSSYEAGQLESTSFGT